MEASRTAQGFYILTMDSLINVEALAKVASVVIDEHHPHGASAGHSFNHNLAFRHADYVGPP